MSSASVGGAGDEWGEMETVEGYLFDQPDDPSNLVLSSPPKDSYDPPVVEAGTLEKLVERLTFREYPDPGFTETFLLTYRAFATGRRLLDLLIMRFQMPVPKNEAALTQYRVKVQAPVQLRVLVPAVENLVSGNALKPKDILTSRKGLTVEVNDTDAEGRLVLGDALAYACEGAPDLMISMATLTGAARVAVGPDLAPYYTDDAVLASALESGAEAGFDPVWRLPFHDAYESVIEPGIADLDNAPGFGFAGSVTAALFLRRFVEAPRYLHFDIYGHTPSDQPARPKGGVGQGARAVLEALPAMLGI